MGKELFMERNLIYSLSIIVLFAAFVFDTNIAFACSCTYPASPAFELASADAVFSGTVTSIAAPTVVQSGADPEKVHFNVSKVWKGNISETVDVVTAISSASCGYAFETGNNYIVYAYKDSFTEHAYGELTTQLCTRTKLLSEAQEDLSELGPGQNPEGGSGSGITRTALSQAQTFIIALLAILILVTFTYRSEIAGKAKALKIGRNRRRGRRAKK